MVTNDIQTAPQMPGHPAATQVHGAKLDTILQAAMATDRLEREQSLNTIAQLRQQQRQLQQAEQEFHMPKQEAARLTQHITELDKQVADLAVSNDELSTDLGRALDVAQRVMDQKAKLQEQCQSQEQQLMRWQAEAQRVKDLEGGPTALLVSYCFSLQLMCCADVAEQCVSSLTEPLSSSTRPSLLSM